MRRATKGLRGCALVGVALATVTPRLAATADFYFVGPDGGHWNDPANWSTSEGGPGGAGIPGNNDNARLSAAFAKNVIFDGSYASPGLLLLNLSQVSNGATVTLNQSANALVAFEENVSIAPGASAVYHQTGGSNTVRDNLHVPRDGNGTGAYIIDDGSLDVGGVEDIGDKQGTFTQNGGTHSAHDIWVGFSLQDNGFFTLNNGSVTITDYLNLGYRGTATLTQAGGSISATHMQMGGGYEGNATYNLQAGDVTINGSELLGGAGIAVFNQTGGTHTMTGTLFIAQVSGSSGTYNLGGGTLNIAGDIVNNGTMSESPAATLNLGGTVLGNGIIHTNGPVVFADQSNINTGTVEIQGGTANGQTFTVGLDAEDPNTHTNVPGDGTLRITGGTTTLDGVLGAGNDGTLTSGSGSGLIDVSGGTLTTKTMLLGSAAGGTGALRISAPAQIVIGGGLSLDSLTLSGGSITVADQPPPAGEDPVLDRSIVGGYLQDGAMLIHAGTATTPKVKLGITTGKTGSIIMDGGTLTAGVLGIGNDATLTGGTGAGHFTMSDGTLNAGTVMLGSTAGGSGDMIISQRAQIVIGGGMNGNGLTMNGGSLTVLDHDPPAGEDPVLNRSLATGYLLSGAITVNAGSITTPNLAIGVTAGKVGTLTLNGGSVTTVNLLASNGTGSVLTLHGGTLTSGHSNVHGGSPLIVGNGSSAAELHLSPPGGTHTFIDGLTISNNARLTGDGAVTGNVLNAGGTVSPGVSTGTTGLLAIAGSYSQSASGTMKVELNGTAPGAGFDGVRITGPATLSGSLNVSRVGSYLPGLGQSFTILTAHPVTGTFSSIQGNGMTVTYTDTSVVLLFTGVDVPSNAPSTVGALALGPIRPNPLHDATTIGFYVPLAGPVALTIHDAGGRRVRTLVRGECDSGQHTVTWDVRNESGEPVRPGVYWARLTTMGRSSTRRIVVH